VGQGARRAVPGRCDKLSAADGEDALAETLKSLVTVVRRGEIRGASNAEVDAYVCMAIRNRALNVLRGRARRRELDHRASPGEPSENATYDEVPDETSPQDAQAVAAEQLGRAEKLLSSWPAEDRYLFLAKLHGVSARVIQRTLEQPPFNSFTAVTTVDSQFTGSASVWWSTFGNHSQRDHSRAGDAFQGYRGADERTCLPDQLSRATDPRLFAHRRGRRSERPIWGCLSPEHLSRHRASGLGASYSLIVDSLHP
jgi:DNA-directed RNA polymerase specialized sigma24 family protein